MPTDVATGFPQIDLQPGATVTVTLDDPGAIITSLVVHGWQEEPSAAPVLDPVRGAYLPGEAGA